LANVGKRRRPPSSDQGCSEYGLYRVLRSIWPYYQLSRCVSRHPHRPMDLSWRLGGLGSGCFPVAFPLQIPYTTAEGWASITASATFSRSASPDNVACWYIMTLQ